MNRKFGISLTLCLLIAHTQPPQAFEVTSVKPNLSGLDRSTGINIAGSHISGENLSLRTLILQAYDLLDFQIAGGPRWLASDRFDKFPAGSLPWVPDMKVESPALCRAGWHPAAGWQPASFVACTCTSVGPVAGREGPTKGPLALGTNTLRRLPFCC